MSLTAKPVLIATAISLTVVVGFASSLTMGRSLDEWYPLLNKPSFQPPAWVFAPVWTVLYILIGTAAGLVWSTAASTQRARALTSYVVQLVLNAAWTAIFFGLRRPEWALVEILLLLALIVWCIVLFRRVKPVAAHLLVPYALWVAFATVLNVSIVVLN